MLRTNVCFFEQNGTHSITFLLVERVMALYPYQAQNEDELSFEKGDVISVLAKEETAWWRGELNGVSGVFPSNYVSPMCKYSFCT